MITQSDFAALTDDLQEVFNEASRSKIDGLVGKAIFNIFDTNRRTYDYRIVHGAEGIEEVTPGNDLPTINTNQGDTATYTQRYFGAKFSVTKEMRKFDLYDVIRQLPKTMVDDAWDKIDQSLADVLAYGWSTSYTDVYGGSVTSTAPDAKCLFNSAHDYNVGSVTYSNLCNDGTNNNPTLARAGVVKTRSNGMVHKDANDLVRPVVLDTLIVAPNNEDLAERTIYSNQMSGSMDNDTNPLRGKIKTILVWPRLETRSDSTDTSAYWYMADSSLAGESLKALFAERPSLDAPDEVYDSKNWEYSVDYFYTTGMGHPAYIFGSNATGS